MTETSREPRDSEARAWLDDPLRGMMPPEELLFFLAADPASGGEAARDIAGRIERWDRFVELAGAEAATAQVLVSLRAMSVALPDEAMNAMQARAALSEFRLLHVETLLERTVAMLQDAGIEVMLVKGAAMAPFVYADFGRRNMADLDVVVAAADAARAQQLAIGLGWAECAPEGRREFYDSHHHLPPLRDNQGIDIRLEIHTDVLPNGHPLRFTLDGLLQRSRRLPFGRGAVLVPSLEDLLLYSCVHFAWSHEMRAGGWKTFRDIAELVRHPEFRWMDFLALAKEPSLSSSAYWALRLASRLCGVRVPGDVLEALRPAFAEGILGLVERHFVLQLRPHSEASPSEWLSRLLWSLGIRPGRSGHGRTRPWQVSERFAGRQRAGARGSRTGRWWLSPAGYFRFSGYLWQLAMPRKYR